MSRQITQERLSCVEQSKGRYEDDKKKWSAYLSGLSDEAQSGENCGDAHLVFVMICDYDGCVWKKLYGCWWSRWVRAVFWERLGNGGAICGRERGYLNSIVSPGSNEWFQLLLQWSMACYCSSWYLRHCTITASVKQGYASPIHKSSQAVCSSKFQQVLLTYTWWIHR